MPDWINAVAAAVAVLLSAAALWRSVRTESKQHAIQEQQLRLDSEHKALEQIVLKTQIADRAAAAEAAERERRRDVADAARGLIDWLYAIPRQTFMTYHVLQRSAIRTPRGLIDDLEYSAVTNGNGHERELAGRIVASLRDVMRLQSDYKSGRLGDPTFQAPAAEAARGKLQDAASHLFNLWADCQLGERIEPFQVGLHP